MLSLAYKAGVSKRTPLITVIMTYLFCYSQLQPCCIRRAGRVSRVTGRTVTDHPVCSDLSHYLGFLSIHQFLHTAPCLDF